MKNAQRKLIPAIAMLLVAVLTLSGATYAWFTMSRTVTATNISLTAIAPTNLLIASTVDGTYGESTTIDEAYTGKLIPASSVTGADDSFFTALNIPTANAGAPDQNTQIIAANTALAGANDGYYADFTLWLKTTGEDDVDVTLSDTLTALTETTTTLKNAFRIAVLDENGDVFTGSKNVYGLSYDYFTGITGPLAAATTTMPDTTTYKGVADTNKADGTTIFTVPTGDTPTPIIVRVWIEGQDAQCINANKAATVGITVGFSDVLYTDGYAF